MPHRFEPDDPLATTGTARWRRGVGIAVGIFVALPVIITAIVLFVRLVS